jgi:hypothetical protein
MPSIARLRALSSPCPGWLCHLTGKAGWRACHRARSLDATLDSMQCYNYKHNSCSSYYRVFSQYMHHIFCDARSSRDWGSGLANAETPPRVVRGGRSRGLVA